MKVSSKEPKGIRVKIGKKHIPYILVQLVAIVLTIAICVFAAILYFYQNERHVSELNEKENYNNALQVSKDLDAFTKTRAEIVRHLSLYYSSILDSPEEIKLEEFSELVNTSCFNYLEYIDKNGMCYSDTGNVFDGKSTHCFQDGILGNSGFECVYNKSLMDEMVLSFYSPVYYEENIIGVLVGSITPNGRISELLDVSFYDYESEIYLCDPNGYIFVTSHNRKINAERKIQSSTYFSFTTYGDYVKDTIASGREHSFIENGVIGCTIKAPTSGWTIISIYPSKAHLTMAKDTAFNYYRSLLVVGLLFMLLVVLLWLPHRLERKEKNRINAQQSQELSKRLSTISEQMSIMQALSREMTDVYIVNTEQEVSAVLKANGIFKEGDRVYAPYASAWNFFLQKHIVPEDREQTAANCELEHVKNMLKNNDEYSFTFHIQVGNVVHHALAKFVNIVGIENEILMGLFNIDERVQAQILQEALKAAEGANRSKTIFLNSMSHDIRTPMNAICGYTSMAKKHIDEPEKIQDYLAKIDLASTNLLELINQVLEMSRIESGKIEFNESSMDLTSKMEELVAIYQVIAETKSITLKVDQSKVEKTHVMVDSSRLTQVLTNIIGNAIKYTPNGGAVEISVSEESIEGSHASNYTFIVKDNGIGMSKEYLEKIFDEFSRERTEETHNIQGTGLGMSIVKRLVDLFSGKIQIESKPGMGTIIKVTIPMKWSNEAEISAENTRNGKEVKLEGLRVLVVDDNAMNREIATELLEESGFSVETAFDGVEALEKVKNAPANAFDVLLMDVQMPRMNGYEATKAIRGLADPQKANVCIIALSANAFEEDKNQSIDAGMDAHIAKPIDMKNLKKTMSRILRKKSKNMDNFFSNQ